MQAMKYEDMAQNLLAESGAAIQGASHRRSRVASLVFLRKGPNECD
jgi:hypothetical protein